MSESKQQKAERMADLIIDVTKSRGECADSDLRQAGFTDDEIRQCGPIAQGFAAVKLGKTSTTY